MRAAYKVRHMENNNESKPVTRAHLFARIDATLLSQATPPRDDNESPKVENSEQPKEDADAK